MKPFILTAWFAGSMLLAAAQERSVAAGGKAAGSGGTVEYSYGLVDYQTISGAGAEITQGVQQPYEVFKLLVEEPSSGISSKLFPNPTTGLLTLEIGESLPEGLVYKINDANGKLIGEQKIGSSITPIDLSGHANAPYYLRLESSGKSIAVYQIVKTN